MHDIEFTAQPDFPPYVVSLGGINIGYLSRDHLKKWFYRVADNMEDSVSPKIPRLYTNHILSIHAKLQELDDYSLALEEAIRYDNFIKGIDNE